MEGQWEGKYQFLEYIDGGSFGRVYKARDSETGQFVAIKIITIRNPSEGVTSCIIREISILKELDHPNIVRLLDVMSRGTNVFLVFEYLSFNLATISNFHKIAKNPLSTKNFLNQILHGVAYCHSENILHRDLKPENVLLDLDTNTVKIADFGLARAFDASLKDYTTGVGTFWYMAPECQVDYSKYTSAVDMWSVGCIFGEMVIGKPLFPYNDCISTLTSIFSLLGKPNPETHVELTPEGLVSLFKTVEHKDLTEEFLGLEPAGVDLLSKMLCLDPDLRIMAKDALEHEYFKGVQDKIS